MGNHNTNDPEPGLLSGRNLATARENLAALLRWLWHFLRPIVIVLLAIGLAAVAAAVIRSGIWWILATLIGWYQSIVLVFNDILHSLSDTAWRLQPPDDLPERKDTLDLGLGAFGGAILLGAVSATAAALISLFKKWMTADRGLLIDVGSKVFVGFLGLWFSLFGLRALDDGGYKGTPVLLGVTAEQIPPARIDLRTGGISFYVGFAEEAGPVSFVPKQELNPNDGYTVTLAASHETFLRGLNKTLRACGSTAEPVKIELRGFASSSIWPKARVDLQAMRGQAAGEETKVATCRIEGGRLNRIREEEKDVQGIGEALACMDYYVDLLRDARLGNRNDRAGPAAPTGLLNEQVEYPYAFNLYLANRRRAEVAEVLANPTDGRLELHGDPWQYYDDMVGELAVNDRVQGTTMKDTGLLSRSVEIRIVDASKCRKTARSVVSTTTSEFVDH